MAGTLLEEGEGLWVEDCVVLSLLLRKRNISHQLGQQKPKEPVESPWGSAGDGIAARKRRQQREKPRSHHPALSSAHAGMWLHSCPVPQPPIWSPAGQDCTLCSAHSYLSLFTVTPRYNHSIPVPAAASSSASALPTLQPLAAPRCPEPGGQGCPARAQRFPEEEPWSRQQSCCALNRSRSRSSVPRAHFSLAGANGRS